MKKVLLILFGFTISVVEAQAGSENVSYSTENIFMRANRPTTKEYVIDGSPYTTGDKFNKVIIKGFSKDVQDLRYNAYEDEMEFKKGEELFYANKADNVKIQFPELNKTYESLTYTYDGKTKSGYLVLLLDNPKFSLYKREKMELLKGEKSPNAYSKDANDYYAKEKDIYLISRDKKFSKFPKNTSEAAELFSIDKKELESFVKSNKINLNREPDMTKLVEFINK
ncbi:hypothetical protein HHL23_06290 [Chryseobacterium sp. RP-3-3]|uniref:Uncharacterized protein n=1 Tax=Chryseobacterium antibioticum TaxID=2728847 RepID=A0A7Y0FQP0_9FLAO|nr:hypothetical protein [Chryseobacterium antibioticum]NML69402.1 hypothetical protein [Chryseobacterium antibioticum]